MSEKQTGEFAPAFPLPDWDTMPWPQGTPADFGTGLTKREWLAGMALPAAAQMHNVDLGQDRVEKAAATALALADALLAAIAASRVQP